MKKLACRIASYRDPDITKPTGVQRLLDYIPTFIRDLGKEKWASFVLDSALSASLAARKYHQYDINAGANDPRQWFGGETDILEELICLQLPGLACNVGLVCHSSEEKIEEEGVALRTINLRGRVQGSAPKQWPEMYRMFVKVKGEERRRLLQTDHDGRWKAGNCIGAPMPCKPTYEALWVNWPAKVPRPPWHGIVYGDDHVGKSTFMSTLPQPIYVAMFDSIGKDVPYMKLGDPQPAQMDKRGTSYIDVVAGK